MWAIVHQTGTKSRKTVPGLVCLLVRPALLLTFFGTSFWNFVSIFSSSWPAWRLDVNRAAENIPFFFAPEETGAVGSASNRHQWPATCRSLSSTQTFRHGATSTRRRRGSRCAFAFASEMVPTLFTVSATMTPAYGQHCDTRSRDRHQSDQLG